MALPLFRMFDDADGISPPGNLVWEGPHEKAADYQPAGVKELPTCLRL